MNISEILNKIKEFYGIKKDAELAKMLDISPQTLSNWKNRNTYDPLLVYTKCVGINAEWLLTGKGSMNRHEPLDKDVLIQLAEDTDFVFTPDKNKIIPLYDLDNNDDLKNILEKKTDDSQILNFLKIPNLTGSDGAAYVKGNSMKPLFKSGDIIIFKGIPVSDIFWGEIYLIEIALDDNTCFSTIKYLNKSESGEDSIRLTSENPAYDSQDIPLNKINAIALIRASIRMH